MAEWLRWKDGSSAEGAEKLCSTCSSTALIPALADWSKTCQKDDGAVLHTWDHSSSSSSCEFCSFVKSEVDLVGAYKEQIRSLRYFVASYTELTEVIKQAAFEEDLQDGEPDPPPEHNEGEEGHSDQIFCLSCKETELPEVTIYNVGSLCEAFLIKYECTKLGHTKRASQILTKYLPYCNQIIEHMKTVLGRHPESESCPVCVAVSDPTDPNHLQDGFDKLGVRGRREVLRNHHLPTLAGTAIQSLKVVREVQVQLSDEGSWKGLIFKEYGLDAKSARGTSSLSTTSLPRPPATLRPAYRQPVKDMSLFMPVHTDKSGFARPTGPRFNVDLIKGWITKCRYDHGEACQKQPTSKHTAHLILIDTERYCLVPIPDGPPPPYFALSYVWGNVLQPILLAQNLQAWRQDGALHEVNIPQKVQDAINLTKEAGLRYLWVDALCIVQDDAELRDIQINQMYLIYHQAEATLVAADSSDCSHGLSGVSQYDQRDNLAPFEIFGTPVARVPKQPKYILEASAWRTRGWTFQEEMCSLRSIVFLPGLVLFSCPTAVWREDINLENADIPRLSCGLSSLPRTVGNANLPPREKVRLFRGIVKQYTQRSLTRAEDMENAFAGISGMIEDLVGPIYHGIPANYFAQVVGGCWFWDMYCTQRPGFPSWSWTGWIYTKEQADAGIEPISSLGSPEGLIQFFKFQTNVMEPMSPISEEEDSMGWLHSDLRPHFSVELNKMRSRHARMSSVRGGIPRGLIAFYSSLAFLELRAPHGLSSTTIREFRVLHPQTKRQMTSITLPEDFVGSHGALHPFIIIAACEAQGRSVGGMRLMLIEMDGDICHKVNVTSPRKAISEDDWLGLNPTKKLVIMA